MTTTEKLICTRCEAPTHATLGGLCSRCTGYDALLKQCLNYRTALERIRDETDDKGALMAFRALRAG